MLKKTLSGCIALFFIFTYGRALAAERNPINVEKTAEMQESLHELIEIIESKRYDALRHYAPQNAIIRWIECGPTDGESFKYSSDHMIDLLSGYSANANIYVNGKPETVDSEGHGEKLTAVISTEGWTSEYPFLDFSFEYSKANKRWKWFGVCYDSEPPINEQKNMKREYYRKPSLPRPGPRIFKDPHALGARISEIIQFENFDALSAYAVKKRVIFSECGQNVIVNEDLEGEEVVPVEKVINYLKRNRPKKDELKVTGHEDIYTAGWRGEFPYANFIMFETKEGWMWAQTFFCKTSHLEKH